MRRASAKEATRGFTLLEVMVAVSILGLSLTVILSSQAGLLSSATRATHLTLAVNLARCRMNETELYLLKNGYPLIDQTEEGPCCADEVDAVYRCEWKIETIQLPAPGLGMQDGGAADGELDFGALGSFGSGASGPPGDPSAMLGAAGPLGALAGLQQKPGVGLGENAGLGDLAGLLGGGEGGPGMGGLASMAMSLAYPTLKPMLEASIRKATVTVKWKEGSNDRDLTVTQYVTDPMRGELDEAIKEQGLQQMNEAASGVANSLGGPSTPSASEPDQGRNP
ncbi:MAG: type II secretion system protein [Polyangiaceae bacterium]|nr:type II secretion system protein [Polyangiaceae bacterium]